ncbi:hypothetical protein I4U23_017493 [Adineta vaga]|nr:hypothetical protein I4U23_017493 [Adineta vaga]
MKKGKVAPVIVETKVGKFLLRDFRPPIQLRTSPRKMKTKIKKDLKRLDENSFGLSTNKKRKNKVKKQLNFHEDNQEEEKEEESSLFIIFNNEQDIEFNEDELTNTKSILCFVNSKTRRMLIFSPQSCRITLLGVFTLEQIFGSSANLHGFTLELSQRYPIFNLSSQSLMSIETTTSKTSLSENQIRTFFDNYQLQFSSPDSFVGLVQKFAKVHHDLSVFHIEQFQTTWIESMKEFSQSHLANQWLFNNKTNSDEDEQTQNNENFKQLWPGMGIFKNSYTQSITYSADIQSITNSIISRLSTKTTSDPLVVFVCGAKDSGKSTYLRYLINRCLSQSSHPKITFLDSDIGQSEFTPSGCISLINNLHQPLFGPAASHLTKPLKSFYFGNIKVENDKLIEYLNYVKYLYDFIQNQRQDLLVVNTMGWGSDSGLVIMKELIDLIKPDILIQLRSSNPHFRHIMPA